MENNTELKNEFEKELEEKFVKYTPFSEEAKIELEACGTDLELVSDFFEKEYEGGVKYITLNPIDVYDTFKDEKNGDINFENENKKQEDKDEFIYKIEDVFSEEWLSVYVLYEYNGIYFVL